LLAFAATSKGDIKEKLEFVFDLHDIDGDGYIGMFFFVEKIKINKKQIMMRWKPFWTQC
jgi:Ca2+-binding EF-hand superfamily protein